MNQLYKDVIFSNILKGFKKNDGGEPGSRTRLHGFRVHVITSDPPSAIKGISNMSVQQIQSLSAIFVWGVRGS